MRPKRWLDPLLTLKASGGHELMGRVAAQPAEGMRGERCDARRAVQSRALFLRYRLHSFKVEADVLPLDGMTVVI